jgi:hypothetical protein
MQRHRIRGAALLAVAVLASAALARAASDARQQRVREFLKEARAQRARAGLTAPALARQYPTPEIQLERALPLAAGKGATVEVQGRFLAGSMFVVESDDVAVTSEQLTARGWRAQLAVRPGAPPQPVGLTVYAPVSGSSMHVPAFIVTARYGCRAELAGGLALSLSARPGDGLVYDVAWTRPPDAAPLRQTTARLQPSRGRIAFELARDEAEIAAAQEARARAGPPPEVAELMKCQQLPQSEMLACIQRAAPQLQAAQQRQMNEARTKVPPCGTLDLARRDDGAIAGGEFRGCAGGFADGVSRASCTPLD